MNANETNSVRPCGPLVSLSYLSTAFLAIAILAVAMVRMEGALPPGPVACGGGALLVLAIGTFRRMRWTMVAAMGMAMLVWVACLVNWWTGGMQPPLVCLLVPPMVIAFNYCALYHTDSE